MVSYEEVLNTEYIYVYQLYIVPLNMVLYGRFGFPLHDGDSLT